MDENRDTLLDAKEAEYLLNHPLLKSAFEAVERGYISQIKNLDFTNDEMKDKLFFGLVNLEAVKQAIRSHIETLQLENYNNSQDDHYE